MKKITIVLGSLIFMIGCNSSKKIEKTIAKGDYDKAIVKSVKKLSSNKQKKKKEKFIVLLEGVFKKAVDRDNSNLIRFKSDNNPAVIEQVYETYIALDQRQELIKPILPLYINSENRNANFEFVDYVTKINDSKNTLSDYLFSNANKLLLNNTIEDARKAYAELEYLKKINPSFNNIDALLDEAHFKGTHFVLVDLKNQTNQIIPRRLEDDLLNFDTYDLNKFWTVFHSEKRDDIQYSYLLDLVFRRIDVSPERYIEKQILVEREIKDGKQYLLDTDGHVVKDSLGNGVKIDKYITVKSDFFEVHQEKACHINTEVILIDKKTNKEVESFPLESEFVFLNDFAEMTGDKRALDNYQVELLAKHEIPFPLNEQIIFDTGEDLKNKLKAIIDDFDL